MIQPYLNPAQVADAARPPVPDSVRNAARVMYAGSAVSVITAVVYLVTKSATKTAIENKHPHLSATTLNTLTDAGVVIGAVIALIGAIFFVWLARSCRNGKNWARITSSVFFGIAVLGTLYSISSAEAAADLVFALIQDLIGLVAVVLLWLRDSSAYFRLFKRPQL